MTRLAILPCMGHDPALAPDRPANRLAREKSPYLLQHAKNPVDWFPWGPEAFDKARREEKPVFLSIGYATCHWCHVMERESFEDDEVARLLNDRFIAVKVDREERPDVDKIYMSVAIGMTGAGGWPLTIVMTPDQKPFFAGTYFPKAGAYGRPGLMTVLARLAEAWQKDRAGIENSAAEAARWVARESAPSPGAEPGHETPDLAERQLAQRFDAAHGGFGGAPKFPSPQNISFLLRRASPESRAMAERTLEAMALGGIHDHLGGGFHRYATDAEWLVPHFEKMLYDQAMLAIAYAEAFQATGRPLWRETAEGILGYVLRDLSSPEGAFHSAEDADSEGLEGKFYVWRPEELAGILGPEDAAFFAARYDVTPEGNFDEPHGPKSHSILHLARPVPESDAARLAACRARLLAARAARVRPLKDDKILADWNGLAIAAFAKAAVAFDRPDLAAAAGRAADFLLVRLRDAEGRLLHRYRDGEAAILGQLDDHAFLAWGLLELYGATFEPRRITEALALADAMTRRFLNEESGAFHMSPADGERLIARPCEIYDGAHPSGNSVAALVFLKLARLTGNPAHAGHAAGIFRAFAAETGRAPSAYAQLMIALESALGPAREIVVAGGPDDPETRGMLAACRAGFDPRRTVLFKPAGPDGDAIARIAPFTAGMIPPGTRATAWVCENFTCRSPVSSAAELERILA